MIRILDLVNLLRDTARYHGWFEVQSKGDTAWLNCDLGQIQVRGQTFSLSAELTWSTGKIEFALQTTDRKPVRFPVDPAAEKAVRNGIHKHLRAPDAYKPHLHARWQLGDTDPGRGFLALTTAD